jgi:hypothetical protein
MRLSKRPAVYSLPSYSLTGDLVAFMRCGLQYRYTRIGQLPSTNPVQAWFGQFIHGVLEEAYREYAEARKQGIMDAPPWEEARVTEICDLIKRRLAAQRLFPWKQETEELGYRRARVAVNELGKELFPLIHRAEVRLTGARDLPTNQIPENLRFREADRYEVVGVIDVITHIQLSDPELQDNLIVKTILKDLPPALADNFEIILDYKGMHRPPVKSTSGAPNYWDIYGWQIQTYAHLRQAHEDSLPVAAGAILYINELDPTANDLFRLKREIEEGATDVVPGHGSEAGNLLNNFRKRDYKEDKTSLPILPIEFRLERMMRLVHVTPRTIEQSLHEFDKVVARIETCRGKELAEGHLMQNWEKNPADESTCTACDAKTFCPDYHADTMPTLPAKLIKQ